MVLATRVSTVLWIYLLSGLAPKFGSKPSSIIKFLAASVTVTVSCLSARRFCKHEIYYAYNLIFLERFVEYNFIKSVEEFRSETLL